MATVDEEAWALWAELQSLTNTELDNLVLVARTKMSAAGKALLKQAVPTPLTGKAGTLELVDAIRGFPEADARDALAKWRDVAGNLRGAAFADRLNERRSAFDAPGRDRSIGGVSEKAKVELRDDLVPIEWLMAGNRAASSVAFFTVPRFFGATRNKEMVGTGFLVSDDKQHVMTAFHVLEARAKEPPANEKAPTKTELEAQIRDTTVAFDYVASSDPAQRGTPLAIDGVVAFDPTLDYAIVKLSQPVVMEPLALYTGALPAVDGGLGFVANIIQHPLRNGAPQPKQLGLRNNAVWNIDATKLFYFTDTRAGSSGSPVFDDGWQVIAIHTGFDTVSTVDYMGRKLAFANRGTLMRKIVDDVRHKLPGLALRVV